MIRKLPKIISILLGGSVLVVTGVAGTLYFPYQQAIENSKVQLSSALGVQAGMLLKLLEKPGFPRHQEQLYLSQDQALLPLLAVQSILKDYSRSTALDVGIWGGAKSFSLLRFENGELDNRKLTMELNDHRGTPMRLALSGQSGTTIALDLRGQEVLAAYRWMPELSLGLVAKIPMAELRRPYFLAVLVNSVAWVVVLLSIGWVNRAYFNSMRKRMQRKDSEFLAIFNSASDGILVMDESSKIRTLNPAALTMFGYSSTEIAGLSIKDLLPGVEWGRKSSLDSRFAPTGTECAQASVDARRKNGGTFSAKLVVNEIRVDNRKLYTCVLRDITAEQETARKLLEAKELAESATEAKSRFLAEMSHEIRTPMNGLIGLLGLLETTDLDAQQKRYQELAQESANSLVSIVNDILDLSKIESGNLTLEAIPFDLNRVHTTVMEMFRIQAEHKNIELTGGVAADISTRVQGDPARLQQILMNLVSNAIKFTEKGAVRLYISKTRETDSAYLLRFEVKDSGRGIDLEEQGNLFKPFVQTNVSDSRLHGGTGLGLSICRRLVELMNGEIHVRSTAGQGSVFWVDLALNKYPLA